MSIAASSVMRARGTADPTSAHRSSRRPRESARRSECRSRRCRADSRCRPSSRDGPHDRHDRDTGNSTSDRMSAPTSTCRFICSNSAAVSLPGLLRMCSGTASLPVSCSSAAASIALSVGSSVTPSARARPGVGLHAPHVAVRHVVLGVDRHRQRLDRRQIQAIELREMAAASSSRPNDARKREVDRWRAPAAPPRRRRGSAAARSESGRTPPTPDAKYPDPQPQEMPPPDLDRRLPAFRGRPRSRSGPN